MPLGWSLLVAARLGVTLWIWKKLSANRLANIRQWMGVHDRLVRGMATVGLFLGLDLWAMNLIEGPTFRQATVLFVLLGVLAALYRRWGWSGICLTLAALMYAPAGLALVMVGVILIIGEWSDLKSFLRPFVLGIGLIEAWPVLEH